MRKHVIPVLLVLACTVMALALPVTAAVTGANSGNSDWTLHYYIEDQKRPMSGVTFYLYQVGEYVSGPNKGIYSFKATRDFEQAQVSLTGLNFRIGADALTDLAYTLRLYTEMNADTVKPTATGRANLPVQESWSISLLRTAPCRYKGSVHDRDLIICTHNYVTHFGRLKNLLTGDKVIFTDINGNEFRYTVVDLEILAGTAIEEMESGAWDLTLFTCTLGGQMRVTVRCELLEAESASL